MQKNQHKPFFKTLEEIDLYRSILCLDGNLPGKDFFQQISLPIIAADGAANTLVREDVHPSMIVGDLDSVSPEVRAAHRHLKIEEQETNDFQKAISYLKDHDLLPTIVLGINGGFLDHILCNLSVFIQESCTFYDAPHMIGYPLCKGRHTFKTLPPMTKLSLIGAPSSTLSSEGLKWELSSHPLTLGGYGSFFNRTLSEKLVIDVEEGTCLILIYLTPMKDGGVANKSSDRNS